MDLIAKLPCVAAKIYRNLYREGSSIGAIDPNLDWSHNFTNMLGYTDPQFIELMRLYLTIHRYGAGERQGKEQAGTWPCPGARDGARSWDVPGPLWAAPGAWFRALGQGCAGLGAWWEGLLLPPECCGGVPLSVGTLGGGVGDLMQPLASGAVTTKGET